MYAYVLYIDQWSICIHTCSLELDENLNDDDCLPEGWKKFTHDSGMPVYLNEEMKVCSFTKPYFLGVNSLKVRIFI